MEGQTETPLPDGEEKGRKDGMMGEGKKGRTKIGKKEDREEGR